MRAAERTSPPIGIVALLLAVLLAAGWTMADASPLPQNRPRDGADEAYSFAAGLFEKGFYERAVTENQAFLRRYPDHPKATMARWRLALSLFELKRFDAAADQLDRLPRNERSFPFVAEALFRRGQCSWELGHTTEAEGTFRRLLKKFPEHSLAPMARFWAGECAFKSESFEKASADYQAVLDSRPEADLARPALYGLAWAQLRLERWAAAEEACRQFQKTFPRDEAVPEIGYLRAQCLGSMNRPAQALAAYDRVRSGPYTDDALLASAYLEAVQGRHEEAARRFGRLTRQMPESPLAREASLHEGIERVRAGQHRQARDLLAALAGADEGPADAERLYWLGLAVREVDGPEAALGIVEQGLGCRPEGDLAQRLVAARADLLFDLGRFREAASDYETAGADRPLARRAAALARLNAGDFAGARSLIQPLLADAGALASDPQSWLILGEARFGVADFEGAATAFTRVTVLEGNAPYAARALSRLGWCLESLSQPRAAREAFSAVLDKKPAASLAADAVVMIARTSLELDQPASALKILTERQQLVSKSEKAAEGLFYLAQAYRRLDDLENARDRLGELTSRFAESPLRDRALYELGEVEEGLGDRQGAAESYARLAAEIPSSPLVPRALYAKAWCDYDRGLYKEAAASALQAVDSGQPGDLARGALELAAEASKRAGDARGAEVCHARYMKLFSADATAAEIGLRAALTWRETKHPEEAVRLLRDLVTWHADAPAAPRLFYELGTDLEALEQFSDAATVYAHLEKTHADDPLAAEAAFRQGEIAYAAGDHEKAAACYRRVTAASRDADLLARALYKLGWSELKQDRYDDAASAFAALADRCPDSPLVGEGLFLAGEALFRAESWAKAVPFFERVRDEHAGHQLADKNLFRLGLSLGHLGRWAAARRALETLRRAQPEFEQAAEADLWLARSLVALGESKTATQVFERVLSLDRGVLGARARLGMGTLHFDAGDYERALAEFLKVALLATTEAEISEGLYRAGLCLERTGEQDKAAEQYQGVIEKFPQSPFATKSRERLVALHGSM